MKSVCVLIQLLGLLLLFLFPLGTVLGLIFLVGGGIAYRREDKRNCSDTTTNQGDTR